MVVLPECFNSPYSTQYFHQYSETILGESTNHLSEIAKETNTYVVGGKSTLKRMVTKSSIPVLFLDLMEIY